ncbi:MAG: carbohydrate ABC transporter permease [Clostridia bacterium]|nr:carbohydrate ABC transporter permease [Clostridia bacterium]
MKKFSRRRPSIWYAHLFFAIYMALCIVPFLMLVIVSFTDEAAILNNGFALIPEKWSLEAYKAIFRDPGTMVQSYWITAVTSIGGSIFSIVVMAMLGYAISRKHFVLRKPISIMLIITMLFSGGLIPTYIIQTQWFGLIDNIWCFFLNSTVAAYTVFIFRTFFATLPAALYESAELDGASEMQILVKIVVPLSTAVIATYTFMQLVGRWNNFEICLYYITNPKLYTLQYLLQNILNEAAFLAELKSTMGVAGVLMPSETLKYAMCVVASLPMLIVFPYFQRYFAKGVTIGSVKG